MKRPKNFGLVTQNGSEETIEKTKQSVYNFGCGLFSSKLSSVTIGARQLSLWQLDKREFAPIAETAQRKKKKKKKKKKFLACPGPEKGPQQTSRTLGLNLMVLVERDYLDGVLAAKSCSFLQIQSRWKKYVEDYFPLD